MSFVVVGTNHKYSPIEIREKFAFNKKGLKEAVSALLGYAGIKGAVILSTCNRAELYASILDIETGLPAGQAGINSLKAFLADYHPGESGKIEAHFYAYVNKEAVTHLFNVACGIDSRILGESQILEQVKFAYQEAKKIEATDRFLNKVFNQAIAAGIKARKETKISAGDASLGSLSVNFIKEKKGPLKDKKILIIGTGKISELITGSLKNEAAKVTLIANRNIEKAYELAGFINAQVSGFDKLKEKLKDADIIISAALSPHLILKKDDILDVLSHQPLLIIDLGLPRNVDPEIAHIKNVELFHLDDFDFAQEESLNRRKQEIPLVKNIIKEEIENLCLTGFLESEPAGALLP